MKDFTQIVYQKISFFGLPLVNTNVGGRIPAIIKDDLNGNVSNNENGYADYILNIINSLVILP